MPRCVLERSKDVQPDFSLRKATRPRDPRDAGRVLAELMQLIRLFRESVTLKPAEASFRQGWQEAMNGQTRPLSELWESVDAE